MKNRIQEYELRDFIFSVIRMNKDIDFNVIVEKYNHELSQFSCDQEDVKKILLNLTEEKKIFKSNNGYRVSPIFLSFKGYYIEYLESQKDLREKTIWTRVVGILPIVGTFIFGFSTLYFNYTNKAKDKEINLKNEIINTLNAKVDSLKKIVL